MLGSGGFGFTFNPILVVVTLLVLGSLVWFFARR
jgi:hypothetical protein